MKTRKLDYPPSMRAIKNEVYSPQGKPFPFTPKKKITDPRSSDSWLETVKLQSGKLFCNQDGNDTKSINRWPFRMRGGRSFPTSSSFESCLSFYLFNFVVFQHGSIVIECGDNFS